MKRKVEVRGQKHYRTSIGNSSHSRPLNKHKRRMFKKYKGQGR